MRLNQRIVATSAVVREVAREVWRLWTDHAVAYYRGQYPYHHGYFGGFGGYQRFHVVRQTRNLIVCAVRGHAIHEELLSMDSGHSELYCTRCGWSTDIWM